LCLSQIQDGHQHRKNLHRSIIRPIEEIFLNYSYLKPPIIWQQTYLECSLDGPVQNVSLLCQSEIQDGCRTCIIVELSTFEKIVLLLMSCLPLKKLYYCWWVVYLWQNYIIVDELSTFDKIIFCWWVVYLWQDNIIVDELSTFDKIILLLMSCLPLIK
jgi:hypothetical protein